MISRTKVITTMNDLKNLLNSDTLKENRMMLKKRDTLKERPEQIEIKLPNKLNKSFKKPPCAGGFLFPQHKKLLLCIYEKIPVATSYGVFSGAHFL